ncbi:MAG: iron-sulfur cluster assembly protein [Solirubrobacterales bacterium]|nr:iron-sulfur cluster assembly protein [Solirubrobacterales bacterium]MBV9047742.1 iron-sulfur cluster assembly protein [Solirubrobacterales bacterium]
MTHVTRAASTHNKLGPRAGAGASRERVLEALDAVIDPELDEPITTLRFVSSCEVTSDGDVDVRLRLPTPQCAPNFAFLMAADARDAVRRLPGVRRVSIKLEDHYTGDEINGAIARGQGFTGAFPGETEDDGLSALRGLFQRKALIARQSRICEELLADGASAEELVGRRVADLPDDSKSRRCLELREQLGISSEPDAPAFVSPGGEPLLADQLQRWLRMARLVRMNLEANGNICRDLLQFRHGLANDPEEVAR